MKYSEITMLLKAAIAGKENQTALGKIGYSKKAISFLKVLQAEKLLTISKAKSVIKINPSKDLLEIKTFQIPVIYKVSDREKIFRRFLSSDYEALVVSNQEGISLHVDSSEKIGGMILGKVYSLKRLTR